MIRAIELTKRFSYGEVGCSRISLSILPGQLYALLGSAGSGKSTVLDLFLGNLSPDSGKALIGGRDCHTEPDAVRCTMAYVPSVSCADERLPAWRYFSYLVCLGNIPSPSRREATRALREAGLPERAFEMPVSRLQPGFMRLLVLAAARRRDCMVLLLDEPAAGLDVRSALHLAGHIKTMKSEGRAILLATRDISFALEVADVVGILSQGVLILEAPRTRQELLRRTYLQAITSI